MDKKALIFAVKTFIAYIILTAILLIFLMPVLLASLKNPWLTEIVAITITSLALYLTIILMVKNSKDDLSVKKKGIIYVCITSGLFSAWGLTNIETSLSLEITSFILRIVAIFIIYQIIKNQTLKK